MKIREQLINSFGITHDGSDDKWKVQESELQKIVRPAVKKATEECEELPSRKRLLKRMKKLAMSFAGKGNGPDDDKEEFSQDNKNKVSKVETNYGFSVINQETDRHNALLAAMIRGLLSLKRATKVATTIEYSALIFDEIDARIADLARSDEGGLLIQAFEKIRTNLHLYLNTLRKCPRASKNILRVMVSTDTCCKLMLYTKPKFNFLLCLLC
jgi:hypothetical protein